VLPSVAYINDHNLEIQPAGLGFRGQTDLRARSATARAQLLARVRRDEWLAVELEGSYRSARFERSSRDTDWQRRRDPRIRSGGLCGPGPCSIRGRGGAPLEIWGSVEVIRQI